MESAPKKARLENSLNPKNGYMGDKLSAFSLKRQIFSMVPESKSFPCRRAVIKCSCRLLQSRKHGHEYPIESASFRLVMKDSAGWFISQPTTIESKKSLLLKATTLEYSSYSIMVNGFESVVRLATKQYLLFTIFALSAFDWMQFGVVILPAGQTLE